MALDFGYINPDFRYDVLIPWGTPIQPGGPEYDGDPNNRPTAEEMILEYDVSGNASISEVDSLTGSPAKGQGVGLSFAKEKFKGGLKKQGNFDSEEPLVVSSSLDVNTDGNFFINEGTLGSIGGRVYAFIGLERIGGIQVYDITDPTNPAFSPIPSPTDTTAGFI
jgi:hypothetical protein